MSEARRPTRVKVGHQWFRIQWLNEHKWKRGGFDPDNMGESQWCTGILAVKTTADGEAMSFAGLQEILLHEILHMVYECASVGAMGTLKEEDLEEAVVKHMTVPLLQVVQDNAKVFEWLTLRA